MKKTQKGITLIALIITIVVLLILAAVAIKSVRGNGIIAHAKNAAAAYNEAQTNELALLDSYLSQLTEHDPNNKPNTETTESVATWSQEGTKIYGKTSAGKTLKTLNLGDTIGYDCYTGVEASKLTAAIGAQTFTVSEAEKTLSWTLLGVQDGKLIITSDSPVKDCTLTLTDHIGQSEGVESKSQDLTNVSAIYGHGNGAISARSIEISDLNRIATTQIELNLGIYSGEYEWENLNSAKIADITISDATIKTFCKNKAGNNISFWLNNSFGCNTGSSQGDGYYNIENEKVAGHILFHGYDGGSSELTYTSGIRPVVTLKVDVQLEEQADGSYDIK